MDNNSYKAFREKITTYTDLGFSTAPFNIKTEFTDLTEKLKFRNNFRTSLGLGIAYKWFSLRLGLSLPGNWLSTKKYGNSQQFNLGLEFQLKRMFFDTDLRIVKGYAIKNAYQWNDSLSAGQPNLILPNVQSLNFSVNAWYFGNEQFRLPYIKGIKGYYTKETHSWYIRGTLNYFGVTNDKAIIPKLLQNDNSSKTFSTYIASFDFGAIPGYAYVNNINNWQFSICGGLGLVLQSKFYEINKVNKTYTGLAPRYDIRINGGYNVDRWFVVLLTDIDNKSVVFRDLKYHQTYLTIRIAAGMRFNHAKKEKTKKV